MKITPPPYWQFHIENLARKKWEEAGKPENRDMGFWFEAEQEVILAHQELENRELLYQKLREEIIEEMDKQTRAIMVNWWRSKNENTDNSKSKTQTL